jgi:hypothetical protein
MWSESKMENGFIFSFFALSIFGAILLILGLDNIHIVFFFFSQYMVPAIFFAVTKDLNKTGFSWVIASGLCIFGIYLVEGISELAFWYMVIIFLYGMLPGFYFWMIHPDTEDDFELEKMSFWNE